MSMLSDKIIYKIKNNEMSMYQVVNGIYPFMEAIVSDVVGHKFERNKEIIDQFIELGFDFDFHKDYRNSIISTPIHILTVHNLYRELDYVLSKFSDKIDINRIDPFLNTTALGIACLNLNYKIVNILVKYNADKNACLDNMTIPMKLLTKYVNDDTSSTVKEKLLKCIKYISPYTVDYEGSTLDIMDYVRKFNCRESIEKI